MFSLRLFLVVVLSLGLSVSSVAQQRTPVPPSDDRPPTPRPPRGLGAFPEKEVSLAELKDEPAKYVGQSHRLYGVKMVGHQRVADRPGFYSHFFSIQDVVTGNTIPASNGAGLHITTDEDEFASLLIARVAKPGGDKIQFAIQITRLTGGRHGEAGIYSGRLLFVEWPDEEGRIVDRLESRYYVTSK